MDNSNLTDAVDAAIANSQKKKKNKILEVRGFESRTFSMQSNAITVRRYLFSPTFIKINAGNLQWWQEKWTVSKDISSLGFTFN